MFKLRGSRRAARLRRERLERRADRAARMIVNDPPAEEFDIVAALKKLADKTKEEEANR